MYVKIAAIFAAMYKQNLLRNFECVVITKWCVHVNFERVLRDIRKNLLLNIHEMISIFSLFLGKCGSFGVVFFSQYPPSLSVAQRKETKTTAKT